MCFITLSYLNVVWQQQSRKKKKMKINDKNHANENWIDFVVTNTPDKSTKAFSKHDLFCVVYSRCFFPSSFYLSVACCLLLGLTEKKLTFFWLFLPAKRTLRNIHSNDRNTKEKINQENKKEIQRFFLLFFTSFAFRLMTLFFRSRTTYISRNWRDECMLCTPFSFHFLIEYIAAGYKRHRITK